VGRDDDQSRKGVVSGALAHLGFVGTPVDKAPGFCEYQTGVIRARKEYWDSIAPQIPLNTSANDGVSGAAGQEDPFIYCASPVDAGNDPGGPASPTDADGDGVLNESDNCSGVPNPDQQDTDADGVGNPCDADDDADQVPDETDNCPTAANADQADADGDGTGNVCDPTPGEDTDQDGVPDDSDNCPSVPNGNQADSDGDGVGDACDAGDVAVTLTQDTGNRDLSAGVVDVVFTAAEVGLDEPITYTFTFGDGATETTSSATTHHVYEAAGDFPAYVTVSDGQAIVNSPEIIVAVRQSVTVEDPDLPTALLSIVSISPANGVAPLTVTFKTSDSHGNDGATLDRYEFDFGDGSPLAAGTTFEQVSHTYNAAGTFTATLTVFDSRGQQASTNASINVSAAAGTLAQLLITPSTAYVGDPVNFDGSRSTAADGRSIVSYTFDFGDGSTPVTRLVSELGEAAARVAHVYLVAGTYQPTLTVSDSASQTAKHQASVKVAPVPQPTAPPVKGGGGALNLLGLAVLLGMALVRRTRGGLST
jgi:PKD repeat protein